MEVGSSDASQTCTALTAINQEHSYSLRFDESPRKLILTYATVTYAAESLRKRVKLYAQNIRRLKKKVVSLQCVVTKLKDKQLISDSSADMLASNFSGIPVAVISRMFKQKPTGRLSHEVYPAALRSFALTLHFYSSKAYVCITFDFCLPRQSVIKSWYGSVDGEPGFTQESFNILKAHQEAEGKEVLCSMMMDEMSIRKHVAWDGSQFHGYVDLGCGINDDTVPPATEALVFDCFCLVNCQLSLIDAFGCQLEIASCIFLS